ncbi:MBL fold metallo-hydrolase [Riemerella columbipharyngis]|uniref:Phosphoribosyl 1,2-cyclic phosphate phosphodiesterase n=1 Tax=Riemerella columbipharyngis TaxID=1071918 RepID=A0A1G6YP72_9FLAO|nr:MBL fold metallo-hydrolase [Riemerella columbipharyngis]SDD92198.1 phosphoribosyl 1,2-cyclic phosphate phosphodiesterase [Riemerella columbipharyngis]
MKIKFLGTGTSQGIPVIGSSHPVCLSEDPKDKRLRTSAIITTDDHKKILIDCGPDFRMQMLLNNEKNVDAVLITHEHNDHIIGLDDTRPIIFRKENSMPIYCQSRVADAIKTKFPYAFSENPYPGAPTFCINIIEDKPFQIGQNTIEPIKVMHGKLPILGYKINDKLAYITDASKIADEEKEKIKNMDLLVINCLRAEKPHHSHYILPEIIELMKELSPQKSYLTHISYELGFHRQVEASLPAPIHLAFDGLEVNI